MVPKLAAMADENAEEMFGHVSEGQRMTLLNALRGIVDRLGLRRAPVD